MGAFGAMCWSVQLLPQTIIYYRRHHTEGLQGSMMLLWATAGVPRGAYNIVEDFNVALKIQPQILTTLSLITWTQWPCYGKKYSVTRCIITAVLLLLFLGAVEMGLVFALKEAKSHNLRWPLVLMAFLSACFLAAGVLRHCWDIYIHRTVRGISFFVGIDADGDLFSFVSVLFGPTINILGLFIYGSKLALWLGMFTCDGAFNLVPWLKASSETVEAPQEPILLHQMLSSTYMLRTASTSEATERRGFFGVS